MRQLQTVLLAGVALFALASTAQAEDLTRTFTGELSGSVTLPPSMGSWVVDIEPDQITGQINGKFDNQGKGGNVEAFVDLNSNLVTFESGTATVGNGYESNSRSGINIDILNTIDGSGVFLEPFGSTIIPAGMGFFVQERTGTPGTNPFTGYGQSQSVGFEAFFNNIGNGVTFAEAKFDFQVYDSFENSLYALSGITSLKFVEGNLVVREFLSRKLGDGEAEILNDFGTASQFLNGFETADDNHHARTYRWDATNIVIPLEGFLNFGGSVDVFYRANVTSWTKSACINNGVNCIVAFSGFGDPVGRGGGLEEIDALSGDVTPFHIGGGDDGSVITGLNFAPVQVSVFHSAAVPEPGTWALMISGFGLAGAALRRRRRVAYT